MLARQTKTERAIAGIMRAIEDDLYTTDMKHRLAELNSERDSIRRAIAVLQQEIAVTNPNMSERFKIMLFEMGKWLSSEEREAKKAKETIRAITQEVLVYKPDKSTYRPIEFTGDFLRAIDGGERGS